MTVITIHDGRKLRIRGLDVTVRSISMNSSSKLTQIDGRNLEARKFCRTFAMSTGKNAGCRLNELLLPTEGPSVADRATPATLTDRPRDKRAKTKKLNQPEPLTI